MNRNRPLRLGRRLFVLTACGIVLAASWAIAQSPAALERLYARELGARIARGLSAASALVPIGIAEIVIALVALYLIVPFFRTTSQVLRRERGPINAVLSGALRVTMLVVVALTAFYVVWGLNYARAPLPARLGWTPIERPLDETAHRRETDDLAAFAKQLVEATNGAYRQFARTDDLERPSFVPGGPSTMDGSLETSFARLQARLPFEPAFAAPRGRAKPVVASLLMNHLRLGGFYFPWTGEANYNHLQPEVSLPHVLAHEKAHQRGIAPEDEANFVGYLACALSDDAYVQYSGFLFAQRQLLGELVARDEPRAIALVRLRVKGVQRDVDFIRAFWQRYEGRAAQVSSAVNDRYLRAQGERLGVRSYEASGNLILLFARQNAGDATFRR